MSRIDPYGPFRRSLLPPERVRELSRLRPARVIVDTLLCWAVIIGAWTAVALSPSWWMVLLALPVIGTRYYALIIIGHDGLHRRLFRDRKMNDLWNDAFCLAPIGAVTRINNRNHLRHHQYLAPEADPDRHKHACFNKSSIAELVGFLLGVTAVLRSALNVFRPGRSVVGRPADDEDHGARHGAREVVIIGTVQALMIGGLTWSIGWWAYPVLWLLPVYAFTFLGDNFRAFAEHSHPEPDAEADEHRLVTYLSNPVERWFLAPMNMNFHAVHHLWPSIPYYNLPVADREIRAHPAAAGLEWRRSYLGYLIRYWLALPLHDCRVRPAEAGRGGH
mgnify:CR=1 FL=1